MKIDTEMLGRARSLRQGMTSQEKKLWYRFLRVHPVKFYKQKILDPYILDFYCAAAHLVIEIDGSQHYDDKGSTADGIRDRFLASKGLKVMRFSNLEIDQKFNEICFAIDEKVKKRMQIRQVPDFTPQV